MSDPTQRTAVARSIWAVMREHEDRCDMELEDNGPDEPIWQYADAALAALSPYEPCYVCGRPMDGLSEDDCHCFHFKQLRPVAPTEAAAMAAPLPPMNMCLCESHRLVLRLGQPYVFTEMEGCESCKEMADQAREAYGPTGGAPQTPEAGQPAEPSPAESALPCGHPASLMLNSAETGEPLYCELCDAMSGRRDAEAMEAELRQKLAVMEASQDVSFCDMQFSPIDGTYVLLYMPTCAEKFVVGLWHGYPDSTSGDWGDGCGTYYTHKPEGWMALDVLERLAAPKGDSNG